MEPRCDASPTCANPGPATPIPLAELVRSPAWLPLDVREGNVIRLVRLEEAAYRAASFLDERILRANPPQGACTVAELEAAASQLTPSAHFIFHIGHVGSTLLSRLVGEDPRFFCIREPGLLRRLATHPRASGLSRPALLSLLSRTWRTEQRAAVKATSFVSELAGAILEAIPGSRALLMYTPPVTYLRSILGGPNSRIESRALAPSRLGRLRRRLAPTPIPAPRAEGEVIAMSWLCEMTALCQAAETSRGRIRWLEFERFLSGPAAGMTMALEALGACPDAHVIHEALGGPLMRQYSKAPEHAYDPALRRTVLESADREHGHEIRAGMRWLTGLAASHRLIAQALAL